MDSFLCNEGFGTHQGDSGRVASAERVGAMRGTCPVYCIWLLHITPTLTEEPSGLL